MDRDYYTCEYRLDGQDRYLIYYSNDTDGVVLDTHNRVPSFKTLADLRRYAEACNLSVAEESSFTTNFSGATIYQRLRRREKNIYRPGQMTN